MKLRPEAVDLSGALLLSEHLQPRGNPSFLAAGGLGKNRFCRTPSHPLLQSNPARGSSRCGCCMHCTVSASVYLQICIQLLPRLPSRILTPKMLFTIMFYIVRWGKTKHTCSYQSLEPSVGNPEAGSGAGLTQVTCLHLVFTGWGVSLLYNGHSPGPREPFPAPKESAPCPLRGTQQGLLRRWPLLLCNSNINNHQRSTSHRHQAPVFS